MRLFSGSIFLVVCLFVFPADLQKVYFLAADSRVIGSPRAGFCSSPHSCWGKSCVFYLFYLTSLRFELRGVMIYTAPALPASAGDFGGRNTRGLPWDPINSDIRAGSEVCESTRQVSAQQTPNAYRTHRASQTLGQILSVPFNTTRSAPLLGHLGQCFKPFHALTHRSHTPHSLPQPLSCRNPHRVRRVTGTPSSTRRQWHRHHLERHREDPFPLCMGKGNEADVFSFGSGLDLWSCRSSVSVLTHLYNAGLVLGAGEIFTCSFNL